MITLIRATAPTLTRPSDTTQYAAGDLIANSVTDTAVTNRIFTFQRFRGPLRIRKWLLEKTDNDVTSAAFLLHLFSAAPTYTSAGDNSAFATVGVTLTGTYLGTMSIAASYGSSTFAHAQGVPVVDYGDYVTWEPAWDSADRANLFGVMIANGTYTPASAGTFKNTLEGEIEG